MSLCIEGRVALASFTVYALLALYQVKIIYGNYWSIAYSFAVCGPAFMCVLILPYNEIVKRAALLGAVFGSACVLSLVWIAPWNVFALYMIILSFFHFTEYMMTALYNPHRLNLDSFLINHSREYSIAAVTSWIEFIVGAVLFPSLKNIFVLNTIGFVMCIVGETLRKLAMITAKSNFSHLVQFNRVSNHKLVQNGIYSWSRHPSYVGWFMWSVGTQILLCNPICLVGYTIASWKFFKDRIFDEEAHLLQFFGQEYVKYMTEVPTRIPFIYGCEHFVKKDEHS